MKDTVNSVNSAIEEKKERLIQKAEMYFSGIHLPTSETPVPTNKRKSQPPISYIFYGAAGLSAIGGLCSHRAGSKLAWWGLAAAGAYVGYKLSQKDNGHQMETHNEKDIHGIKNEVTAKVLDITKRLKQDWEEFMETQQQIIQQAIQNSDMDSERKDTLMSKVFVFEIIDISMLDFNNLMRSANELTSLHSAIDSFKATVKQKIEQTAAKQIGKYNDLVVNET